MPQILTSSMLRTLLWLAGWLLVAAIAGVIAGELATALAIALAVYLAFHLYRLLRFAFWLRHRRSAEPPDYDDLWGEIIASVHRLQRRKQFHKRRVADLLRAFRRMTAALPDGVVLLNADNEISWFNERAGMWLKLNRKRDFGLRVENFLRHPEFADYIQRVQSGEFIPNPPVIPMPGGLSRWVSLHLVHTRDAPQRLLIVRDVTRQVMMETMRKEFVANASHELRSPLTVVTGYLESLGENDGDAQLPAPWREPFGEMRRQAERMRAIIDDLLELSRLEGRIEPAGLQPVDVGSLLQTLRKDAAAQPIAPAAVTVTLDSHGKLRGEESELASAFGNLLSNAVKYTPRDGAINVRWWADDSGGYVAVSDTGIGIAAEHLPRLTERFYRVDAGRSRELGGSGLGLAIVKHVLQRHDAELRIHSEVGKGSTFVCHFPAQRVIFDERRNSSLK